MSEEEYFEKRVNDQIDWFDRKSSINKKNFMRLRAIEIVLALMIPFIAGYVEIYQHLATFIIGISSIVVAAIASILTLYKFQENWVEYRSFSEALKYEKFLYLTKAGIYREKAHFSDFAERIEGILSKENAKWSAQNTLQQEENQVPVSE